MKTVLFLHSETSNPYELYQQQLLKNPVYRDETRNITAIYSYADCVTILNSPFACVPPQYNEGLNEHALLIAGNLARFRNMPDHDIAKKAARELLQHLQAAPISKLLAELLNQSPDKRELNWVHQVSRKLPVMVLLKGFGFNDQDCEILTAAISAFVKIMQPLKTSELIEKINSVSKPCYQIIENHIIATIHLNNIVNDLLVEFSCSKEEALAICVANLAGLMTQSYNACSGLLSYSLLYALTTGSAGDLVDKSDQGSLQRFVTEVLRYEPPVHNTRRVATKNILLNETEIRKGENILLVLAAANRDEKQFSNANSFDVQRPNNQTQLTFGAGMHACVASQFAINMAAETLYYFYALFPNARLLPAHIEYEPIINARLPVTFLFL